MENSKERGALRNNILARGFDPLPLNGKTPEIRGWSTIQVTTAWLKRFNRSLTHMNTGVRCYNPEREGCLVAVDIDVDNSEHADVIEGFAEDELGQTDWCRFGRGERRLLLYWCPDDMRSRRSGKYGGLQVEILAMGRQFAAYGIHPDTGQAYEWTGANPAQNAVEELPETNEAAVDKFLERAEEYLAGLGLPQESEGGKSLGEHDYCLTADMEFEITEPALGMMTVAAIKEAIGSDAWVGNLTALRPTSDSDAGRFSIAGNGKLRVTDFTTDVTYFETYEPDAETIEVLNTVLPEADETVTRAAVSALSSPNEQLEKLLSRYVYVADGTIRDLREPTHAFRWDAWSRQFPRKVLGMAGNPIQMHTAFRERCEKVTRAVLEPEQGTGVFEFDDERRLNLYVPPDHTRPGGSITLFSDFTTHLIPDARERNIFYDWLALKLQKPWMRLHALMMVTPTFGTGRGTLFNIMSKLIGERYCTETTLMHLTGQQGQAQYNDYLSESLLVGIPEARVDFSKGRWYARRDAYEAVKQVIDTTSQRQVIRRKGLSNTTERIYASVFISSNHYDALAIEPKDRRLIVLDNTQDVLSERDALDLYDWLAEPRNIDAVYQQLIMRTPEYRGVGIPPDTTAKRRMTAAAASGPDEAFGHMVDAMVGDIVTANQWRTFARSARAEHEIMDWPEATHEDKALNSTLQSLAARVHDDRPNWQMKIDGTPVRPWIIRNREKWEHCTDNAAIRAEIMKNGDPGGGVIKLPER